MASKRKSYKRSVSRPSPKDIKDGDVPDGETVCVEPFRTPPEQLTGGYRLRKRKPPPNSVAVTPLLSKQPPSKKKKGERGASMTEPRPAQTKTRKRVLSGEIERKLGFSESTVSGTAHREEGCDIEPASGNTEPYLLRESDKTTASTIGRSIDIESSPAAGLNSNINHENTAKGSTVDCFQRKDDKRLTLDHAADKRIRLPQATSTTKPIISEQRKRKNNSDLALQTKLWQEFLKLQEDIKVKEKNLDVMDNLAKQSCGSHKKIKPKKRGSLSTNSLIRKGRKVKVHLIDTTGLTESTSAESARDFLYKSLYESDQQRHYQRTASCHRVVSRRFRTHRTINSVC